MIDEFNVLLKEIEASVGAPEKVVSLVRRRAKVMSLDEIHKELKEIAGRQQRLHELVAMTRIDVLERLRSLDAHLGKKS